MSISVASCFCRTRVTAWGLQSGRTMEADGAALYQHVSWLQDMVHMPFGHCTQMLLFCPARPEVCLLPYVEHGHMCTASIILFLTACLCARASVVPNTRASHCAVSGGKPSCLCRPHYYRSFQGCAVSICAWVSMSPLRTTRSRNTALHQLSEVCVPVIAHQHRRLLAL